MDYQNLLEKQVEHENFDTQTQEEEALIKIFHAKKDAMASTIRRLVPDESSDEEKVSSTSQQKSVKSTGYKRSLSNRV